MIVHGSYELKMMQQQQVVRATDITQAFFG